MFQQPGYYQESERFWQNNSGVLAAGNHRTERFWYIAIASLFISTTVNFRHRDLDDLWGSNSIDSQVLYQLLAWFVLGVIAIYRIIQRKVDLSLLSSGPIFWFFCYAVCALFSTIYSINPAYTFLRSSELLVGLILIISMKNHLNYFFTLMGIWILINWLLVLVGFFGLDGGISWIRGPDDAFVSYEGTTIEAWRFGSAFGHPATISIGTAMAAIWLAATITWQDWRWKGPMMIWMAITNILAVGRLGIASMILGLVIVALGRRVFFPLVCVLCVVGSLVIVSDGLQKKLIVYLERGQSIEELESLNGRAGIYEQAFNYINKAPIYGYGFRSGRMLVYNELSSTVHAHNAFLESYVSLGVLGLFLIIATLLSALLSAFRLLIKKNSRSFGWQFLALLVPVFTYSISETGFAADFRIPAMLFITFFAYQETIFRGNLYHSLHKLRTLNPNATR